LTHKQLPLKQSISIAFRIWRQIATSTIALPETQSQPNLATRKFIAAFDFTPSTNKVTYTQILAHSFFTYVTTEKK
jgi:hypothetical protein